MLGIVGNHPGKDRIHNLGILCRAEFGCDCAWTWVCPLAVLVISAHCFLAASCALHFVTVSSRVRLFSLRTSSTASPSRRPVDKLGQVSLPEEVCRR